MTILIVDDIPINLRLLRAMLEAEDHTIVEAADGIEALAVLERENVDVIISDILMPRMDGYRFCYEVRASKRFGHLPIIIYTSSYISDGDERLALEVGADKFIRKPAPLKTIVDALAEVKAGKRRPLSQAKEVGVMKEYSERLVAKLEEKNTELTVRNRELQASEEQLRWRTALFEAQMNCALDGILIVDNEGKKVLQNQRMRDMWKIPQEFSDESDDSRQLQFITGRTCNPAEFARRVSYLYAHPNEISRDEIELLDGRTFDRYSAPVRDTQGGYYGRIWMFRDVTEGKKAMEQIAEHAELLDKTQEAITVCDLEGRILFWNKGAERMYGWTRQDATGRMGDELIHNGDPRHEEGYRAALTQNEWTGEVQYKTKGGQQLTIEARLTLVRDREGRPKSVLAINTDITEKKKIEAQFMRAQRMESIGTLAGGIAHDLNNILAPIMMAIDLLKDMTDRADAKSMLEDIEISARRGADIVQQVLSFARGMDGQRIEIQPQHLLKDINHIVKNTFPKDIHLELSIPSYTWTILGDPTQVHQLVLNLCVNARDAMPNGGNLTIKAENFLFDEQYAAMNLQAKAGPYVIISVTDSGTGISQDVIDKIFEPFFTTKEVGKGTGLGLSTAIAIVKSHHGFIDVYSEPGTGTTFKVCLPAQRTTAEYCEGPAEPVILPRGDGEMVLVVDDEPTILTVTGQTLRAFGYRVLTASNGAEAVAVYAQHRNEIDVVLTDMAMPIMDGPATIHALLNINPLIRIIAASGLNTNASVAKAAGAGVEHFLPKPYTSGTLLKALQLILNKA